MTLVELLEDNDVEFVVYDDGEEVAKGDDYGEVVQSVIDSTELDVGVEQAVEGGISRPIYLDAGGVIQKLLEIINTNRPEHAINRVDE